MAGGLTLRREGHNKALRAERSMALHLKGWTYRQIASELGISVATAHDDVRWALAQSKACTDEMANLLREKEHARLNNKIAEVTETIDAIKQTLANQQAIYDVEVMRQARAGAFADGQTPQPFVPDAKLLSEMRQYIALEVKLSESIRKLMGLDVEEVHQILVPVNMGSDSTVQTLGDATRGKTLKQKMDMLRDRQKGAAK